MSNFTKIQAASLKSQTILAEMQGAPAGVENVLLASGQKCFGIFGNPRVLFIPAPGGGYRKKTEVMLTITRAQLTTPPAFQSKLVRTDISPNFTYTIDHIDTQDPFLWVLTLANFGRNDIG